MGYSASAAAAGLRDQHPDGAGPPYAWPPRWPRTFAGSEGLSRRGERRGAAPGHDWHAICQCPWGALGPAIHNGARPGRCFAMAIRRDFPSTRILLMGGVEFGGGNIIPNYNDLIARFRGRRRYEDRLHLSVRVQPDGNRHPRWPHHCGRGPGAFSPDERADTAADLLPWGSAPTRPMRR